MMTNEPVTRTPHIMFIMFLINVEINIQLQCHVLWKDCNYLHNRQEQNIFHTTFIAAAECDFVIMCVVFVWSRLHTFCLHFRYVCLLRRP